MELESGRPTEGWIEIEDDGFCGLVGPIFHLPFEGGKGRFRFTALPKHKNRAGFVHGGMLMTFADRGLGMTARHQDPDRRQATVQLDVHFIRPVSMSETVEMECRVMRQSRSLVFMDGDMFVGTDIVATARGVWKIIEPDRSS